MLRNKHLMTVAIAAVAAGSIAMRGSSPSHDETASPNEVFSFVATQAYLVGEPTGTDRFQYDGESINPIRGGIVASLNPSTNSGSIVASFFYEGDSYLMIQDRFDRIVTNVELHGQTGMGPEVLPRVFTQIATWGPASVWKNGELLYEDIPAHLMLTESVRDEVTHKVDFRGPRNVASYPGSVANPYDDQVHFVVHTDDSAPGHFPPNSWFTHFMADVVTVN